MTQNDLQKRLIKALTEAPALVFKKLLDEARTPGEKDQIKRIADALNVKI